MDRAHVTLLALFDVSVAFDTVDQNILIHHLLVSFGISGKMPIGFALFWMGAMVCMSCTVFGFTRSHWVATPFAAGFFSQPIAVHFVHC